jgi:curli biogenesis system outer membrane secretion channel CsgG
MQVKRALKRCVLIFLPFLAYSCAPSPQAVKFDEAFRVKDYESAYSIIKDVCAKTPQDKICERFESVKKELAETRIALLRGKIDQEKKPIAISKLEAFKKDASLVLKAVDKEMAASTAKLAEMLKDAGDAAVAGDVKKATDSYLVAVGIDASVKPKFEEYSNKTVTDSYANGVKAAEKEEWATAHKLFYNAYVLRPDYAGLKEKLDEAGSKDSVQYYISEGEKAFPAGNFDRAIIMFKGALAYKHEGVDASLKLLNARVTAVNSYFSTGLAMMDSERPLSAALMFIKAKSLIADIQEDKLGAIAVPSREINRLVKELYVKGAAEAKAGGFEAAYLYMRAISRLEPGYPEIATEKDRLKDEIRKRSIQSLAIIPFKGTSYSSDAGGVITSSILDYLYRDLSKDVKILERGANEALLRESEVKMSQGGEGAKGFLQLLGADYLLLGDVVNYKVESNVAEMNKMVRARTGSKKVANPAYDEWKKDKKGEAPPQFIEEPINEDIRYKTTHYNKSGVITVSFRIVDAKGDVINTGLAEKKVEAEDWAAEGVEIGEFKNVARLSKIPTDIELLRTAQTSVVSSIVSALTTMFSNPEQKFLKEMEDAQKRANFRTAVEKAVDAIFTLDRKGMDTGATEERLSKLIVDGKF